MSTSVGVLPWLVAKMVHTVAGQDLRPVDKQFVFIGIYFVAVQAFSHWKYWWFWRGIWIIPLNPCIIFWWKCVHHKPSFQTNLWGLVDVLLRIWIRGWYKKHSKSSGLFKPIKGQLDNLPRTKKKLEVCQSPPKKNCLQIFDLLRLLGKSEKNLQMVERVFLKSSINPRNASSHKIKSFIHPRTFKINIWGSQQTASWKRPSTHPDQSQLQKNPESSSLDHKIRWSFLARINNFSSWSAGPIPVKWTNYSSSFLLGQICHGPLPGEPLTIAA